MEMSKVALASGIKSQPIGEILHRFARFIGRRMVGAGFLLRPDGGLGGLALVGLSIKVVVGRLTGIAMPIGPVFEADAGTGREEDAVEGAAALLVAAEGGLAPPSVRTILVAVVGGDCGGEAEGVGEADDSGARPSRMAFNRSSRRF